LVFIELVESLKCVRPHELTWLVASAFQMEERDIVSGVLGCPTCGARYPIEHGIADFRDERTSPRRVVAAEVVSPELPVRVAALLDLVEPGGFIVLAGEWTAAAPYLEQIVERVHVLGIDPVEGVESGGSLSLALGGGHIPLRPGTERGIAQDARHVSPEELTSAVEVLRPRGRLLAPVTVPLPVGVDELARDAEQWVAIKSESPSAAIPLRRARQDMN
jgi:hypothetical protein